MSGHGCSICGHPGHDRRTHGRVAIGLKYCVVCKKEKPAKEFARRNRCWNCEEKYVASISDRSTRSFGSKSTGHGGMNPCPPDCQQCEWERRFIERRLAGGFLKPPTGLMEPKW